VRKRVVASGFASVLFMLVGIHVASAAPVLADQWPPCVYVLQDDPYVWIEVCPPLFLFGAGAVTS
jgi:hypothetical protein